MFPRMESLMLIDRLCICHETQLGDGDAAEMMRVITAVTSGGMVTILTDGPVGKILQLSFKNDKELWLHVQLASET